VGGQESLQRAAVAMKGDLMHDPKGAAWRQAVEILEGKMYLFL
jgi:hypothetical protein